MVQLIDQVCNRWLLQQVFNASFDLINFITSKKSFLTVGSPPVTLILKHLNLIRHLPDFQFHKYLKPG